MKSTERIQKLRNNIETMVETVTHEFIALPQADLNRKESETSWSILECLEHLNRYSRYYNARMADALDKLKPRVGDAHAEARSTWLGRKFIAMMHPSNMKKQKTLKHMNPANSALTSAVIDEFLHHQKTLLVLLARASAFNLSQGSVPVEFLKLLRMNLGDALEFVTVHQQRHVRQALRAKAQNTHRHEPALKI
ncbi:DinB family protein [Chryseolinea lacunae]|uniref:DinB family protein n=1 Tax=Chryseolinea lacunae TaxID=2801331 RepID=A0ABS1KQB1_9BACT|nr:DinB family protein [Chryseolinea lacunae]MBL0741660.1 DinB family protein [Chryseolinea lacunae]